MRRYFIFNKKKCRVYAAFGVSQTPSILLHHLPDSGYARCQYIYFLFGFLTMIFHSVRRVGFHLYMAVSTLQLTSIRNLSEYWQLLRGHTSRCRSIFGFHILLSDTAVESCVTFKPRKAPIQLIQFSRFNNQKFCKYTFLYLFRFNAIISPLLLMSIALHAF